MKKPSATLSVPLSSDVTKRLKAIAEREHRSPEELTAEALTSFVSEEESEMRLIAERSRVAYGGAPRVGHARVAEWLRSWGSETEVPRPKPAA